MFEALDDHEGSVSIGGRLITNFRFADDIVVNAEEEEEAGVLIDRLDRTTTRYKMEIGPNKTKVMTNNPNGFQREIKIKSCFPKMGHLMTKPTKLHVRPAKTQISLGISLGIRPV